MKKSIKFPFSARSLRLFLFILLGAFSITLSLPALIVSADPACAAPTVYDSTKMACVNPTTSTSSGSGGTSSTPKVTQYSPTGSEQDSANGSSNCTSGQQCDLVTKYINPAVLFLTAFIGIAVTISIIYGGIEYGSSGGDPSKVAAGKNRIRNAIFTLIAYFFLYQLYNFLLPGGVSK